MKTTLSAAATRSVTQALRKGVADFGARFPGESGARQAVHTVYGGAHLFRADTARKLGEVAERFLAEYAGNLAQFARALELPEHASLPEVPTALEAAYEKSSVELRKTRPHAWLACAVYDRVLQKLRREPVEDFRLDFEDGYGNRPNDEEDACAVSAAGEVARGMQLGSLPPFIGIRIKPFSRELTDRGIRTLDLFLTSLIERTRGELPSNFVVTLPKVVIPEQVATLTEVLGMLEAKLGITEQVELEIMVETPQAIIGPEGRSPLPRLVEAAGGRCVAAHFGVYDYTASLSITAEQQTMRHRACDHARHVMQVALAGTGVWLSDGATNVLPVPVHRPSEKEPLTPAQRDENRAAVYRAWRLHFTDVQHSLEHAYYQGWDLHPAQLPTRYAALYAFFLRGLDKASERLRAFVDKAGQATLVGDVFDDAATGQGLLNFFLRGLNCGAIREEEAMATGLSLEELRSRSFLRIIEGRRKVSIGSGE